MYSLFSPDTKSKYGLPDFLMYFSTSELIFAVNELFEDEVELVAALMFTPVFFSCTDYRRKDVRQNVESGL